MAKIAVQIPRLLEMVIAAKRIIFYGVILMVVTVVHMKMSAMEFATWKT